MDAVFGCKAFTHIQNLFQILGLLEKQHFLTLNHSFQPMQAFDDRDVWSDLTLDSEQSPASRCLFMKFNNILLTPRHQQYFSIPMIGHNSQREVVNDKNQKQQ